MQKKKIPRSEPPTFWESLKIYLLEIIIAFGVIYFLYWLTLYYVENS
ncbi:MAG: hypothetical protein HN761_00445 [Gammaproteobacteria bacterium]|nr:hypothetical protein [Gammaproteobacteria bacterium]MBT7814248.1 hypothetical protein [Gammaproteobacteria bacterium]